MIHSGFYSEQHLQLKLRAATLDIKICFHNHFRSGNADLDSRLVFEKQRNLVQDQSSDRFLNTSPGVA